MRNWIGQDIVPGVCVYRGARDGNSSSFRIGRVVKVDEKKRTARIDWFVEPSYVNLKVMRNGHPAYDSVEAPRRISSSGSPGLDSLVLMPEEDAMYVLNIALQIHALWYKDGEYSPPQMTADEFKKYINNYTQNELGRKEGYYG